MTTLSITFPPHWECQRHPQALHCSLRIKAWLRKDFPTVPYAFLNKMDIAGYSGWPFAACSARTVYVVGKFFSYWIVFDDILEKGDTPIPTEEILSAFSPFPPLVAHPLAQGWSSCVDEFRYMPQEYLRVWKEDFKEWMDGAFLEREAFQHHRETGKILTMEEYMEIRRITVGQAPSTHFMFLENPALWLSIYKTTPWKKAVALCVEIVAMINDFFSYQKDREADNLNLLYCFCQGHLTREALCGFLALFQKKFVEFDLLAKDIPPELAYGLQSNMYGFWVWHGETSGRYFNGFKLEGEGEEEIKIIRDVAPQERDLERAAL